jgi:hypothetical protein
MKNLEQKVTNCNPLKNSNWRTRAASHYAHILEFLKQRGASGVLSSELYDNPALFGRSPRNRISEMRAHGLSITTIHVNASTVRYILREGPRDWYQETTGSPRPSVVPDKSTTLPLFESVER